MYNYDVKYILKHGHLVVDKNREYLDGSLLLEDGIILDAFPFSNKINNYDDFKEIDLTGKIVMPGFFDSNTYGDSKLFFENANNDEIKEIETSFYKNGTTSYIASISSKKLMSDYDNCLTNLNNSNCLGINLDGPFLSSKYSDSYLKPCIEVLNDYLSKTSLIKQVTLAYELDGSKKIGEYLHKNNIKVMCGHSDACLNDLDENVDGISHLYKDMRGFHHSECTLVNCAFSNIFYCGIVADESMISKDVLKLIFNNIDIKKIMLISDDSGISIAKQVKTLFNLGYKLNELLCYSSLNAFRFYGLDNRYGTLDKGKYADLLILDDELNIANVIKEGRFIK